MMSIKYNFYIFCVIIKNILKLNKNKNIFIKKITLQTMLFIIYV